MKAESTIYNFGDILTKLRKSRGLTQQQLAEMLNVSRRVISYYEGETKYPPTHLIAPLSKALKVSSDELLGIKKIKDTLDNKHAALWRKLKVLETFSEKDKKAVLQFIEVIADKNIAQQEK